MTTQHPDTPETGITPGGTSGAFRDVLSKDHARRGKPPLHFVDMTPEQRVEKAAELGLPKFRVKQLANHYFGHFDVNAAEFTDFPAAKRSEAAAAFFPQLITEPFHSGLVVVFGAAAVMMLLGAVASMFNPGTYATEPGADNAA